MFLDDELLMIGRECDLTEESIFNSINKMINASFTNLLKRIGNSPSERQTRANFRRVNNTWYKVAEILEKENKGFVKKDGFQLFVESKPEFKDIFFNKQ